METIGITELWTFPNGKNTAGTATNDKIRRGQAHAVKSFLDLATKVAELQFLNREHVLLFRGQTRDHRNLIRKTTLKPTLFRGATGSTRIPEMALLEMRFATLFDAEQRLIEEYQKNGLGGLERLKRQRILRWAILQHYEVCSTPLLDVTHSLRIAASFASLNATRTAYVFVLGVPNISGAITASAEGGLQIIRLSSVCPPSAVRPHIQEGYLLGEYPEMADYRQKENYRNTEIDFGRRLVAKFSFSPKTFWKGDRFPVVGKRALYPNSSDPLYILTQRIKSTIEQKSK